VRSHVYQTPVILPPRGRPGDEAFREHVAHGLAGLPGVLAAGLVRTAIGQAPVTLWRDRRGAVRAPIMDRMSSGS
jgi:hypothetical protein